MKKYSDIKEYTDTFEKNEKQVLLNLWKFLQENIKPNKKLKVEETINYGIPTFKVNSKNFIHFAGFKKHYGIYPGSVAIKFFEKDLLKFKTSTGTIQIPYEENIPKVLIKKIIKFNLKIFNL